MSNYYFVATFLPALKLGTPPEITFEEFNYLLQDNLSAEDLLKTAVLRRFYDIKNLRTLWKKEELDFRGNFDEVDLEDAILTEIGLPGYFYEFLDAYHTHAERLKNFSQLLVTFFKEEEQKNEGFLTKYLKFEREWRLVFLALRAKKFGKDLLSELQFEDPNDEFTMQILSQKDAPTFYPPEGYENLKTIFEQNENDPLALYRALAAYRFNKIEELMEVELFSIDRILGYLAQLIIVEKELEMDKKKGMELINHL